MKICQNHWDQLRQSIKAKGLFDLVAASGAEAVKQAVGELQGEQKHLGNFDPLMAANWMLMGNALQMGGLYLMGQDKNGQEYCPVCEAETHGHTGWIDLAVEGVAEAVKTLPPTPPQN